MACTSNFVFNSYFSKIENMVDFCIYIMLLFVFAILVFFFFKPTDKVLKKRIQNFIIVNEMYIFFFIHIFFFSFLGIWSKIDHLFFFLIFLLYFYGLVEKFQTKLIENSFSINFVLNSFFVYKRKGLLFCIEQGLSTFIFLYILFVLYVSFFSLRKEENIEEYIKHLEKDFVLLKYVYLSGSVAPLFIINFFKNFDIISSVTDPLIYSFTYHLFFYSILLYLVGVVLKLVVINLFNTPTPTVVGSNLGIAVGFTTLGGIIFQLSGGAHDPMLFPPYRRITAAMTGHWFRTSEDYAVYNKFISSCSRMKVPIINEYFDANKANWLIQENELLFGKFALANREKNDPEALVSFFDGHFNLSPVAIEKARRGEFINLDCAIAFDTLNTLIADIEDIEEKRLVINRHVEYVTSYPHQYDRTYRDSLTFARKVIFESPSFNPTPAENISNPRGGVFFNAIYGDFLTYEEDPDRPGHIRRKRK